MANAVMMKVMMMLKRCPEYDTYEGNAETTNVALHTCDYVPPNDYPRCMKSIPSSLISHLLLCDYPKCIWNLFKLTIILPPPFGDM